MLADTADQLRSLVPYIGVPGTLFVILFWMMNKKILVWGRELDYREAIIAELKQEKDMWRDEALQNNHQVSRAADIADRAATVAEKAVNAKGK